MPILTTLADLQPAPHNPRRIDDDSRHGLSASMRQFGDIAGIVWNRRTGWLIAGHQRVAILSGKGASLELEPEPRIVDPDTGEVWQVRVVDWDEQTADAAMLEANNQHIAGHWTDEMPDILARLTAEDPLMVDDLGLNRLLRDIETEPEEEAKTAKDETPTDQAIYPLAARLNEAYHYVVVYTENELDWTRLKSMLGITKARTNKSKTVGEGRAVSFARFKASLGIE